jgi:hypothetical protein
MTRPPSRFAATGLSLLPLGSALLAALATTGCDNPACVFSPTQCQPGDGGGGPGGIGSFSAIFPSDASWITPSAPTVVRFAPAIGDAHPQTPLIVEFDQSLDPASLGGAFEVLDSLTLTTVPLLDPPALVGDGRVVVLTFPSVGQSSPLVAGSTYLVRFTDDQAISDVTGQAFDFGMDQDIFEFGVTDMPPALPRVVYSYPADDSILASDLTEVVVAFDRRMLGNSFTNSSFVVTGGETLVPPPAPSTLILTGLQSLQSVLQVWLWSNTDGNGPRQSLGADASVRVRLSPAGSPLLAEGPMGGTLAQTDIEFRTALVRAPEAVFKVTSALPLDAIGLPNLGVGSGVLQVDFADASGPSDTLELFIVGGSPANAQLLKAEQRTVPVPSGVTSLVLSEAELALREPSGVSRFRDGEIEFMARVRRGTAATVARRTDGDTTANGFQRLVLDLTPPQLLGLGVAADSVTLVRSELGGVVMVGRGDEEIRYARVSATIGIEEFTNNTGPTDRPPVALSSSGGRFIATPVMGVPYVIDPDGPVVDYTVEVFDRALNPAVLSSASGQFEQVGVVGPAPQVNTGSVTVRVFDADTGAPLDGARVMSHSDDGSVLVWLESELTIAGAAEVIAAGLGLETVVTVQLTGYDSFTFHGVPVERFAVPLPRIGLPASIRGVVRRALNPAVLTNVNWVGDNRALPSGSPLIRATNWAPDATGLMECTYGPFQVRPHRLGLTTFFSTDPNQSQGNFNASAFLTGTALRLTDEALGYGTNAVGQDLTVSTADIGVLVGPDVLDINSVGPFDPLGAPIITVEAVAPGLEGAPTLGIGTTFADTPGRWFVLGATPSTSIATLVTRGAIEPSLQLRAEVVDMAGNRIGTRPHIGSTGGSLTPIGVPSFLTPGPMGTTGGEAYGIEVADVIPDAVAPATMDGLYRVVLTDPAGRRWHLWALDQPGMNVVRLAVPPVAGAPGGTPPADGMQTARVSAWAWPDFDRTLFLWADVERRHELFAHTYATPFTQN